MKALRFLLRGKTAFFKQPDVNTYCYYTYGCIHKVALLGIFGAMMGFRGYNGQTKAETYPEFYEKLKNLKVSICPLNEKGYIPKKVQTFNNSVGYASKEEGGNLIVKEQWLENPKWEITFLIDDSQSRELAERILESRFEFLPYLGKNDHTWSSKCGGSGTGGRDKKGEFESIRTFSGGSGQSVRGFCPPPLWPGSTVQIPGTTSGGFGTGV